MRILYILWFTLILPYSKPDDANKHAAQQFNKDLWLDGCRKKREVDEEDVINRFEMERVSPLYDILRHLPPFEDGWLSNPVTSPTLSSSPSSVKLKNESASYGEFKIEVKKDEEHVVSESGRQFKENSALNWYYSAESYSSIDNFSNTNTDRSKPPTTTFRSSTNALPDETPKSSTLRRQDEEHVVSHVPSLKGGRGAFLDFNLLESSTTPKVESTIPAKIEEPKPNVTTRYILLQSGRIVAINVTSVSSVLKPTSSGSPNKNPLLPTFYFGSRIRNKNTTKTLANNTLSTVKPEKLRSNLHTTAKHNTHAKANSFATIQNQTKHRAEQPTVRTTTTRFTQAFTIQPNVEYSKSRSKVPTSSGHPFTITPNVEYAKSRKPVENKSQQQKQLTTTNSQQSKEVPPSTKFTLPFSRETSTLDPAQIWWNEMKAAKNDKTTLLTTTLKPKVTTLSSSNILKTNAFQPPSTAVKPFTVKTFDSVKKTEDIVTHPGIELTANARSAKLRMTEKSAVHFSTTTSPVKASKAFIQTKAPRSWTTFPSITVNHDKRLNENPITTFDGDLLEPSVPLSEIRHDFVRIVTLPSPAPVTQAVSPTASVKASRQSPRRPRYRGLSHVTLQAPRKQHLEAPTTTPRPPVNPQPQLQLTTVSNRRTTNYQYQHRWSSFSNGPSTSPPLVQPPTTLPPRRSRNGFYLRNSVSFQTIPPGSLTDRRTLSRDLGFSDLGFTTVESLQPQLEDLLIITFEPTRKSMGTGGDQNISEINTTNKENARFSRPPTQKANPISVVPRIPFKTLVSTENPHRRMEDNAFHIFPPDDGMKSRSNSGNRVGRNFRNNNSRFQSVTEKTTSSSTTSTTTKQPFRVYYFEPKRKKSKHPEGKNETSLTTPPSNGKLPRNSSARVQSSVNRGGNNPPRERGRNAEVNHRSHARQAKQLQHLPKEQSAPAETTTTAKPLVKKLKSSPFIWHRPNVGTAKPVVQNDASLNPVAVQGTINDSIYRPAKVNRTG